MPPRPQYDGPALLSFGFRPFFLAASLFALLAIPAWLLIWRGALPTPGPLGAVDWHIHEMTFGYAAAVVAGFLFTAVPNWTGRMPVRGWPLLVLVALWLVGRLAVSGALGVGGVGAAVLDSLFLFAVAAMIAREIVAGRNWRNLKVLVPITLLACANVLFHVESITQGTADYGRRLGIGLLVFLIMLIGGRVVPSFTRNWMAQRGAARLPIPFNRFDGICLAFGGAALLAWTFAQWSMAAALLLGAAGLLHLVRLVRWRGHATLANPLLAMLHVAYLFIPAGLIGTGLGAAGLVSTQVGAHLLTIGGVGGMTMAVMMRATMGHTGRALAAGPLLTAAFGLLALAALARLAGATDLIPGYDGITLAALLWTAAYALLCARIGPWLARPKAGRKAPSRAAAPHREA